MTKKLLGVNGGFVTAREYCLGNFLSRTGHCLTLCSQQAVKRPIPPNFRSNVNRRALIMMDSFLIIES